MTKALTMRGLAAALMLATGTFAVADDGILPESVITRLVANAHATPLGPVEDDVTAESVESIKGMMLMTQDDKDGPKSVREGLATDFNSFTLEGPPTMVVEQGDVAIYAGKVKLDADAVAQDEEDAKANAKNAATMDMTGGANRAKQAGPVFGPGITQFLSMKVPADGEVLASFCLVLEKGAWKVHCLYFSTEPLEKDNEDFLLRQLADVAKGAGK